MPSHPGQPTVVDGQPTVVDGQPTVVDGPPQGSAALVAALREEARILGFARLGVAAAAGRDPRVHDQFRAWLAAGLGGAVQGWLTTHEPLRRDAERLLPGVRSVIMLATDHPAASREPAPPGRGRVASYAWGDDYHGLLRQRVNALAAWLEARLPGCRTRGVVDSAPLSEREFGWLAGLGWFGKNTMLIHPLAGSHFFLTGLLTDASLPDDAPITVDHCGTCTACLDACPTGAFVAPRVLDAGRCISSLSIEERGPVPPDLRAGMGDWLFGCDECQRVCPWNRLAPGSGMPSFQPREGMTSLDLIDLLSLDEAAFRDRFRGSPLLRAKRGGLLRSAAINLGNEAGSGAPARAARVVVALSGALTDPHPLIRGAAAWALGRWLAAGAAPAWTALTGRLPDENDEGVRGEITAALGGSAAESPAE
jgi:epoxyqueuosine reductase